MTKVLILGGGTAGTLMANRLRAKYPKDRMQITVIDKDDAHLYQPGLLFLPFSTSTGDSLVRSRRAQLRPGIDVVLGDIDRVLPDEHTVQLTDGRSFDYELLILATGVTPHPDMTPGLLGDDWGTSVHEFYTLPGAKALQSALRGFTGGNLVVEVMEMPIKCPVAPLEFSFLADDYLDRKALRRRTKITYVTPLDGAFTKPVASREIGNSLAQRKIDLVPDFVIERVDQSAHKIVSYDGREVDYDLLVTIPVNVGADYVARSGLGNEVNLVPNDKFTMVSDAYPDILVMGDGGTLPTSKAGAVAHFSSDVAMANMDALLEHRPLSERFDGHANCFVEMGRGQAMLLDFNYDVEPLTGQYPFPVVGPMKLLAPSPVNHMGKLAFEQMYWHMLLPGRPMPVPSKMSMAGKVREIAA